jgi:hypothetical protein
MAKEFTELVRRVEPRWSKAYLRFCLEGPKDGWTKHGSKASYAFDSTVVLIDPFEHKAFYQSMNDRVMRLPAMLGKDQAVVLVARDSAFHCDIKFEYQNLDRWNITKMHGGTGIPEGVISARGCFL